MTARRSLLLTVLAYPGALSAQNLAEVPVSPPSRPPPGSPPAGGQAQPPATSGVDPFAGQVVGSGPAAVLRIEPPTVYLLPSENTRVSPRALREDGSPAAPVTVTWKSLRPDIASVDQNGVFVQLAPGPGTVQ